MSESEKDYEDQYEALFRRALEEYREEQFDKKQIYDYKTLAYKLYFDNQLNISKLTALTQEMQELINKFIDLKENMYKVDKSISWIKVYNNIASIIPEITEEDIERDKPYNLGDAEDRYQEFVDWTKGNDKKD